MHVLGFFSSSITMHEFWIELISARHVQSTPVPTHSKENGTIQYEIPYKNFQRCFLEIKFFLNMTPCRWLSRTGRFESTFITWLFAPGEGSITPLLYIVSSYLSTDWHDVPPQKNRNLTVHISKLAGGDEMLFTKSSN